jgi:hypothetical protein
VKLVAQTASVAPNAQEGTVPQPKVVSSAALKAAPDVDINNAQVCYPVLSSHTPWFKPGNALFPKMLKIKQGAPQLNFPSGKSAFVAMKFTDVKKGNKLQVMLVRDPNITKISTVFIPDYLLLDENYCQLSGPKEFIFEFQGVTGIQGATELADVVVGPNEKPAYLLLYSDAEKNGDDVDYRGDFGLKLDRTIRTEHGFLYVRSVKAK